MIPVTVAGEIRETILDYLRTTFNLQDGALEAALFAFLRAELFKGPYVDLRLPFRTWDGWSPPAPARARPNAFSTRSSITATATAARRASRLSSSTP
jgi:hypothetical protein